MKKKIKNVIKIIIFILIFVVILNRITLLCVRKGNGYGTDILNFYKQKKNTIDIIYLGSSHSYTAFNPYLIEKNTGLNGYVFATQQQPIWITYYHLKEALKYQNPKYVILELHMPVVQNEDFASEEVTRDGIDKMKTSINKIQAINNSVEKFNDRYSYYFNIMKYHTRYKDLSDSDWNAVIRGNTVDNKGYIELENDKFKFPFSNIEKNNKELKITSKNEIYLNKIIKLAKDNKIELIFVKTPTLYNNNEYSKLNYIEKLANKNNI